jgi:hypothetical protein
MSDALSRSGSSKIAEVPIFQDFVVMEHIA